MSKKDYDDEYEKPKRDRSGGGFWGKFFAVLLGILLGIILTLGGLVGGGYIIATQVPVSNIYDFANNILSSTMGTSIPGAYTDYVAEAHKNKSAADLVVTVSEAVTSIADGTGTLNTLSAISPYVKTLVEGTDDTPGLVPLLEGYGVTLDVDKLMDLIIVKPDTVTEEDPDKYLLDYIMDRAMSMPVSKLFETLGLESNSILDAILHGENGERDMTIAEFASGDLEQILYDMPIDSLLPISTTAEIMMRLAYGEKYRYTISGSGVTMNQVKYTLETTSPYTIYDEAGELVTVTDFAEVNATTHTYKIKTEAYGEHYVQATDYTNPAAVKVAAYVDEACQTALLYPKTKIGDLKGDGIDKKVQEFKLGELIDTSGNRILTALSDTKIKDINSAINSMPISQMVDCGTSKILNAIGSFTILSLKDGVQDLQLNQLVDVTGKLGELKISELTDAKIKELPISDLIDIPSEPTAPGYQILNAIAKDGDTPVTIAGLGARIEKLTLGDLVSETDIAGCLILQSLANKKVSELSGAIQSLPIEKIVPGVENDKLLKHLTGATLSNLAEKIENLHVVEVLETDIFYCKKDANGDPILNSAGNVQWTYKDGQTLLEDQGHRVIQPLWKYMLATPAYNTYIAEDGHIEDITLIKNHSYEENKNVTLHNYNLLNEMGIMMQNLTTTLNNTTLGELYEDGMLKIEDTQTKNAFESEANKGLRGLKLEEAITRLITLSTTTTN